MAKANEKKYERTKIEQGAANSATNYNNFVNPIIKRAPAERANVISGYQNFAAGGGLSDEEYQQMRDAYSNNIGSPTQANLQDFSKERGVYNEFADTGGFNPADIQRVRAQAASSAPSLFNALKERQALSRANLGSNVAAGAGIDFKATRQAAQQGASDRLGANIGLKQAINTGRLQGAEGLTGIDTTMGNQSLANASMINNYNLAKSQGASDVEARIAALKQSGREYGQSGLATMTANDQQDWLNAIGAGDASQRGWQGLSLDNDQVNKSSLWGNIGKGIATASSWLKGFPGFGKKGKDNKAPTTGPGGGGTSPRGGPPPKDSDAMIRMPNWDFSKQPGDISDDTHASKSDYPGWEQFANPGETFSQWYYRMQSGGGN